MTKQHPITPPPELVEQWFDASVLEGAITYDEFNFANLAAQWGADQELEAMLAELKALHLPDGYAAKLHAARRPKPPSLKEQALEQLRRVNAVLQFQATGGETSVIRRALEALDD
jgi:hypothetical protein